MDYCHIPSSSIVKCFKCSKTERILSDYIGKFEDYKCAICLGYKFIESGNPVLVGAFTKCLFCYAIFKVIDCAIGIFPKCNICKYNKICNLACSYIPKNSLMLCQNKNCDCLVRYDISITKPIEIFRCASCSQNDFYEYNNGNVPKNCYTTCTICSVQFLVGNTHSLYCDFCKKNCEYCESSINVQLSVDPYKKHILLDTKQYWMCELCYDNTNLAVENYFYDQD
jgi:hypothetical protein